MFREVVQAIRAVLYSPLSFLADRGASAAVLRAVAGVLVAVDRPLRLLLRRPG